MVIELTRRDIEWLKRWLKRVHTDAKKNGCEGEEVNGFIIDKWERCKLNKIKTEYAPNVERLIPWIVKNIDIKNNKGEKLEFDVECDKFVSMMGSHFKKLDYYQISNNVRRTLFKHGLNVKILRARGIKYYRFYALGDEDVRLIEKRMKEGMKRRVCRRMVRKICDVKMREDDDDELTESIWTDTQFINKIADCNFDVDRLNDRIDEEKEKILHNRIRYGLRLLWDSHDTRVS